MASAPSPGFRRVGRPPCPSLPQPAEGQTPSFPRAPTLGSRLTSKPWGCGSLKQGESTWRRATLGSALLGQPHAPPGSRFLSLSFYGLAGKLMFRTKVCRSCQNCFPDRWQRTIAPSNASQAVRGQPRSANPLRQGHQSSSSTRESSRGREAPRAPRPASLPLTRACGTRWSCPAG